MPNWSITALAAVGLALLGACKDGPKPPDPVGPPAQLVPVAGNNQSAPANTELPQPIRFQVQDADGTPVGAGHEVTFLLTQGGGTLIGSQTASTGEDGTVTAPRWKLGKSNVPQTLRAALGIIFGDASAKIATQYNIEVRFFGDPISADNRALFENAAARLEAIITGDVVDARAENADLNSFCNTTGLPTLNETIDDIIIFAAITTIDGPSNTLAQASPCVGRPTSAGTMVAAGLMKFDAADFPSLSAGGNIQEVITHEMLHVLGSGTIWTTDRNLLQGQGSADPRFRGAQARQACQAMGAVVTCASSVPLENTGGSGTRDFHWRESVFGTELMTGFLNSGTNPLSPMTVASMADLGFVVNSAAADPFTFTGVTLMSGVPLALAWEQVGQLRGMLRPDGRVEKITPK
jgi:hypothetical protein